MILIKLLYGSLTQYKFFRRCRRFDSKGEYCYYNVQGDIHRVTGLYTFRRLLAAPGSATPSRANALSGVCSTTFCGCCLCYAKPSIATAKRRVQPQRYVK